MARWTFNRKAASKQERDTYDAFRERLAYVAAATGDELISDETAAERDRRVRELRKDFQTFCQYYFAHLIDADFAYFHRDGVKRVLAKAGIHVWEWPRGHAKSIVATVMLILYLLATGRLRGVVLSSNNLEKAIGLLSDVRAEIEANERWRHDYGALEVPGAWRAEHFQLRGGMGFWAFGRKQSPRGVRVSAKRPNLIICDDIDDKELCRNQKRVRDVVAWMREDLYGTRDIAYESWMLVVGNRIHPQSCLAHVVGDLEPGDKPNPDVAHSKVYALQHPDTREMDLGLEAEPAWKERFTREQVETAMRELGSEAAAMREYFHQHSEPGIVFKPEWLQWCEKLPAKSYDQINVYGDPSWKDTQASDYKAIVAVARVGPAYRGERAKPGDLHVIAVWIRRTSALAMVQAFYDFWEEIGRGARYYIEANLMQDLLFRDEFKAEGRARGHQMPIRLDKRKKPDKVTRIENLGPLLERGLLRFCRHLQNTPDFKRLKDQLLGFPHVNDDGPDALEGAVSLIQKLARGTGTGPRSGGYQGRSGSRRGRR